MSAESRRGPSFRPFLRTSNVLWSKIDLSSVDRMHFTDEEAKKLALQPGDLLVCEGGDVGRTAIWNNELTDCLYQNHIHRLRRIGPDIEPQFAMYWLQEVVLHRRIYDGAANRTTIPNLSSARLKEFAIPLPRLDEQRVIAKALSTVQRARETQEKITSSLRELKAATAEGLFAGEEGRRVEISKTWPQIPLGDLIAIAQYGLSVRGEKIGKYPILRMNCQQDGEILFRNLQYIDLPSETFQNYKLSEGDLLFNRTNSYELVGRTAIFYGRADCVFASYLIRLKVNCDLVLPHFLNYYLNLNSTQVTLKTFATRGVSQSNINASKLRLLSVPVPPMKDQKEIVRKIAGLDRSIAKSSKREEFLAALFSAVLDGLMTGKIRIPRS